MLSTFWKSMFITFAVFILMTNIIFTFDLVNMINPSAYDLLSDNDSYSNYYFGMSSFIDAWKDWFGDSNSSEATTFLSKFNEFLIDTGKWISTKFSNNGILNRIKVANGIDYKYTVLACIMMIVVSIVCVVPVLILVLYGALWILYMLMFICYCVLFIFAFMGGAFRSPLPSTDWYQYNGDWPWVENTAYSLMAILV